MAPLILMGLTGLGAGAGGAIMTRSAVKADDMRPTIFGYDSRKVTGVASLLLGLVAPPMLAAPLVGLAAGSFVSWHDTEVFREGIVSWMNQQAEKAGLPQASVPQLPGPTEIPSPPVKPGLFDLPSRALQMLFSTSPTPTAAS